QQRRPRHARAREDLRTDLRTVALPAGQLPLQAREKTEGTCWMTRFVDGLAKHREGDSLAVRFASRECLSQVDGFLRLDHRSQWRLVRVDHRFDDYRPVL